MVLGAGGYFLLSGDGVPLIGPAPPDPAFAFATVDVETTTTGNLGSAPGGQAKKAANQIEEIMASLYTVTFVDEGYWGDYGDAWGLFEDTAAERAEADMEVLTLGGEAGSIYDRITLEDSTLSITVLTNDRARPVSAIAEVSFTAAAELSDGTATAVTSEGSYFLRPGDDGWLIYAYRVERDEQAASPSPTAEASS